MPFSYRFRSPDPEWAGLRPRCQPLPPAGSRGRNNRNRRGPEKLVTGSSGSMDAAGLAPKRRGPGPVPPRMAEPRPLFDDTSGAGGTGRAYGAAAAPAPNVSAAAAAAFLAEPVSSIAAAYGSSWASQGRDMVDRNIDRFLPLGRLKYYFAVDTAYVRRKLGLLFFPFLHQPHSQLIPILFLISFLFSLIPIPFPTPFQPHPIPNPIPFPPPAQDWQVQYQQDGPVAPRFDVNAPDLYIPAMAFITYLLVAGLALGTQNRFSPDSLGLQASSALAWLLLEVLAVLLSLYLFSLPTDLTTPDLLAFAGYKYVGMIAALLAGLLFGSTGYHAVLGWCCLSIFIFMVRSLRLKLLAESAVGVPGRGSRSPPRTYLTATIAAVQPVFMYALTAHLVR